MRKAGGDAQNRWALTKNKKAPPRQERTRPNSSNQDYFGTSVLKGGAGNPALLKRFALAGLFSHAYRTAIGCGTIGDETTTVSPSIFASAQTNFLSSPATAKPFSGPSPFTSSPPPKWVK